MSAGHYSMGVTIQAGLISGIQSCDVFSIFKSTVLTQISEQPPMTTYQITPQIGRLQDTPDNCTVYSEPHHCKRGVHKVVSESRTEERKKTKRYNTKRNTVTFKSKLKKNKNIIKRIIDQLMCDCTTGATSLGCTGVCSVSV